MGDLLNGFKVGMQLGAPFVEAQLRKREFQRQAALQARDQANRSNDAAAERLLRRDLARGANAAAGSRLDRTLGAESTKQQEDIKASEKALAAKLGSAEKIAADQQTVITDEGDANRALKSEIAINNNLANDSIQQTQNRLQKNYLRRMELEDMLKSPQFLSDTERTRAARAELLAINNMETIVATAASVSINKNGIRAFDEFGAVPQAGGTFSQIPRNEPTPASKRQVVVDPMSGELNIVDIENRTVFTPTRIDKGSLDPPVGTPTSGVSVGEVPRDAADPMKSLFDGLELGPAGQLRQAPGASRK